MPKISSSLSGGNGSSTAGSCRSMRTSSGDTSTRSTSRIRSGRNVAGVTDQASPVSIVLTNYNGLENLKFCLPGVVRAAAYRGLANEVIVVRDRVSFTERSSRSGIDIFLYLRRFSRIRS